MAGVRKKPQPNGKFCAWFIDMKGRQKFFAGTRSKSETLRIAERLEDEHRQIRLGYRPVPSSAEKHAKRSIGEVIDEFLAWGQAQGGIGGRPWGTGHARMREAHLTWWKNRLGLNTLADVPDVLARAEAALRELQEAGLSGKTLQNYRDALGTFCSWAVKRGYLDKNPIAGSGGFDITPRRRRRALTLDEIHGLLEAAPPERRLVYEVALTTGLRAGELRALTVQHLDTARRGLCLEAAWTKNRKPGFQPLPASLLQRLIEHSAGKPPEVPLLDVPAYTWCSIAKDLLAADIPLTTPEGKVDFHALRTTFTTLVFESGANVKEAMSLVRHGTPGLTINTYARTRQDRLAEVIEKVGKALDFEPDYAVFRTKQAVGAEGLDVSGIRGNRLHGNKKMDVAGFEPATSWLQTTRSPN